MKAITVRITKARDWYADKLGEIFEVYSSRYGHFYLLKQDYDKGVRYSSWHFIRREDCVEVEEVA